MSHYRGELFFDNCAVCKQPARSDVDRVVVYEEEEGYDLIHEECAKRIGCKSVWINHKTGQRIPLDERAN